MDSLELAKKTIRQEAQALESLEQKLNKDDLESATKLLVELKKVGGNLIFCGVGKSGLVGQKLAATFSSLGLPSFFLHPTDALHGDLGRHGPSDILCLISKSASTEEILKVLPFFKTGKEKIFGFLGKKDGPLAQSCGLVFDCSVSREACLNNQAPTTSIMTTLSMGHALAVIYEEAIGLSKEGFAINHPAGFLGKALSLKVSSLMVPAKDCPIISENQSLKDGLLEMTNKRIGGCAVLEKDLLVGLIVEGDIRRTVVNNDHLDISVKKVMNRDCVTIGPDELAFDALKKMEDRRYKIDILPVVEDKKFLGLIQIHDLWKQGFASST